jgi:hypothetical protein
MNWLRVSFRVLKQWRASRRRSSPPPQVPIDETSAVPPENAQRLESIRIAEPSGHSCRSLGILPDELLELILLQADDSISHLNTKRKHLKMYARTLCLVCQHWKLVIYGSDRFWETHLLLLFAPFPGMSVRSSKQHKTVFVNCLKQYRNSLEDAGGSDIRVNITGPEKGVDAPSEEEELMAKHFALLRQRSTQIRSISFAFDPEKLGSLLSPILQTFHDLKRLERVTFWTEGNVAPLSQGAPPFDFSRAISMTELELNFCNLIDCIILPPYLRSFAVRYGGSRRENIIQWREFYNAVHPCVFLTSIELCGSNLDFSNTTGLEVLDLPQLTKLDLDSSFPSNAEILQRVRAPRLAFLRLSLCGPGSAGDYKIYHPRFCKLRQLSISIDDWDNDVEHFLNQTTPDLLESLDVEFCARTLVRSPSLSGDLRVRPKVQKLRLKIRCYGVRSWFDILERFQLPEIRELDIHLPFSDISRNMFSATPVDGRRLKLCTLAKVQLTNFHSEEADIFCTVLDVPSLTTLVHDANGPELPRQTPFPRPRTSLGQARRDPPMWYSRVTKLELSPIVSGSKLNIPEHPFSLFHSVNELTLTIQLRRLWDSRLTDFFAVLGHRSRAILPNLHRLTILLCPLVFTRASTNAQAVQDSCQEVIETVVRKRQEKGFPLEYVNLSVRLQVNDSDGYYYSHVGQTVTFWSYGIQAK